MNPSMQASAKKPPIHPLLKLLLELGPLMLFFLANARWGIFAASLPIVVVLPEPLTPTTRMTDGFFGAISSGFAAAPNTFSTSPARICLTSSGVTVFS